MARLAIHLQFLVTVLFSYLTSGYAPDLGKIPAQPVWYRVNPKTEYPEMSNKNKLPISVETRETDGISSPENQDE